MPADDPEPARFTAWVTKATRATSRADAALRMFVILAFVGVFIGVGISAVFRAGLGEKERTDFTVYHAAGVAVLQGTPLYEAQNARG